MNISKDQISSQNKSLLKSHKDDLDFLREKLSGKKIDAEKIITDLAAFQVAIPSWALGAGGTRFGRFSIGGEPRTLEEKLDDIGILHALTRSAGAISLHIPWDIPKDTKAIKERAASHGIAFDAMNSNTFQDQAGQQHSYKFGSLCHTDNKTRKQAVDHNIEVIGCGKKLGSKSLTVWLADGSNFPGQNNFRVALLNVLDSLKEIYKALPTDWKMFIEYKCYEPNFYSSVIPDWGTSFTLANELGPKAFTLVDLGHHLPNANIEQVVSTLMTFGKLGGFHFNDSKYGDDDLTVGSIKPYQLFLIFQELVWGLKNNARNNPSPAWMIDASHNVKDPLEDLLQSLEAIKIAYAQALLADQERLAEAQQNNDPAMAQEVLQEAFRTDVRPLLHEARVKSSAAIDPIGLFRKLEIRRQLIKERGQKTVATGL